MTIKLKSVLAIIGLANGFLVAVAAEPAPIPRGKPSTEKIVVPSLEGKYAIVAGARDGKPIPEDRLKGLVVAFTKDKIVGLDKDKRHFFAAAYVLEQGRDPWVIRMTSTIPMDAQAVGLIKKEGDVVTLVYSLPGAALPKEFRTQERQHLFVMKQLPR